MLEIEKMERDVMHKVLKVENIFKIPYDPDMQITFTENTEDEPFQKELKERAQLIKDMELSEHKNEINKTLSIIDTVQKWSNYIFKIFTNNSSYQYITIEDIENNKIIDNIDNIYFSDNRVNKNYYKLQKDINMFQHNQTYSIIQYILYCYKHLKKNGSCIFTISIPNIYLIHLLYFLTFIFYIFYEL